MKITVVRHGQTEYNLQKKIQGRKNIPLSDTGRRECKKLKYEIKEQNFDICFSSPLIRAVETAMILVGDRVKIKIDKRLIERSLGKLEGKNKESYDYLKYWDYEKNIKEQEIEPIQELFKRVQSFINDLEKDYQDKSILIVTHTPIVRAIHHLLYQSDLNSNLCNFKIGNCYIEQIDR